MGCGACLRWQVIKGKKQGAVRMADFLSWFQNPLKNRQHWGAKQGAEMSNAGKAKH